MFLVATIISLGLPVAAENNKDFYDALDLVTPVTYPLRGFAYISSIYLLILLTFERYIALNAASTGNLHRKTYMEAKVCFIYKRFFSELACLKN